MTTLYQPTYQSSKRRILYEGPDGKVVLVWSFIFVLFIGYVVYTIEQSVNMDHCKFFKGEGMPSNSAAGRALDKDINKAQYPAEAQRWFW